MNGLCFKSLNGEGEVQVTHPISKAVILNLPSAASLYYTTPCCGEPPAITLFLLLRHDSDFATVKNCNVNV